MIDILYDIVGLMGVSSILVAYLLLQSGKLSSNTYLFQLMNLLGALCIIISLMHFWNFSSFVIEICWLGISLWGIWKVYRKR